MAFTKTPMQSTEQTKTVNLFYGWDIRGDGTAAVDTQFKNALVEPIGEEYAQVLKRDGTELLTTSLAHPGPILGMSIWNQPSGAQWLVVINIDAVTNFPYVTTFQTIGGPFTSPANTQILTGTGAGDENVFFQEFLYQNGSIDICFSFGNLSYKMTNAFALTSLGVNSPPGGPLVYLDGYLFGMTGQNIINSNLNDPGTWSASNFLAVDSYPDLISEIARVGPYLVAFGSESIQYFFDAANPTGSPISANVGATRHIGYLGGLANIGDDILFIGKQQGGSPSLYRMTGLKVTPVASFQFSRVWITQSPKYQASVARRGSVLVLNGHSCYFVRTNSAPFPLPGPVPPPVGVSYIYDMDGQVWSKLGYKALDYYLIKSAVQVFSNGLPIVTMVSVLGDGSLHRFNPTIYQDDGVNFEVGFRTKPQTFGTSRTKFGQNLLVLGDQTSSVSSFNVSWSDDDYQTFSTPRQINLANHYQQLFALGQFRKRAFVFTYSDNFPMRWQSIELTYDQGTQ